MTQPPPLVRLFHTRDAFLRAHVEEWKQSDPPVPFETFLVNLVLALVTYRDELMNELLLAQRQPAATDKPASAD